jgi:hypothetical protein
LGIDDAQVGGGWEQRAEAELDDLEVARRERTEGGFSTSLFQRVSHVPLTYRSDPLSATIRPYRCIARKIFCTSGGNVERLRLALSRSRAPMGSAPAVEPARCDAG